MYKPAPVCDIPAFSDKIPRDLKNPGNLFVHTGYVKINHKAGNAEYAILIDKMGTLNVEINTGHDSFSLEDGKVILKTMFENIGLNAELVDELEFGMDVV